MRPFLLILLCVLGGAAPAQPASTAPTAPRYTLVMPPGFEKVTVGAHIAICQPNDVEWVKKSLAEVKPATRPTTMPADLLKRVTENRPAVVKQMVADFALADDKEPNRLFDEKLLPTLTRLDQLKPPVYFLVCTREKLRELTSGGWGEPRFHYNRVAGEVSIDDHVYLSIERPMDDAVLIGYYAEKDPIEHRIRALAAATQKLDADLLRMIAEQSQPLVFNLTAQHLGEHYLEPLKLRRDQQWLALGVAGYFAAKYAGQLTPYAKEQWLKDVTFENPRYPVSARGIDLTRPAEESTLRPVAIPFYTQAMRRKSIGVVAKWAQKSGDASVTKVLAAVGANKPTDGAALLKLVKDLTGEDLTKDLGAQ
ncbi:MAG TPA: hypothetical protein VH475_12430 [Tepidisphaeraceae bacterium]|jgi:hypothetical protein